MTTPAAKDLITPRVWIGSLYAYNCGRLIGEWSDATDADELHEVAKRVLAEGGGEEIALMDFEGFGDLIGEYSSLENVAAIGAAIEEHGPPLILFAGHVGFQEGDDLDQLIEDFQEAHQGSGFDSLREYAVDFLNSLFEVPTHLERYIDYEAVAADLEADGTWIAAGHVFCRV